MWQYVDYFPPQVRPTSYFRLLASLKRRAESAALPINAIPSLIIPDDIAVRVQIMDVSGNIKADFYFLTKPHVTIHRLLINIKKEYLLELPDLVKNYKVDLVLSQNDLINRLAIGNDSLLIVRSK